LQRQRQFEIARLLRVERFVTQDADRILRADVRDPNLAGPDALQPDVATMDVGFFVAARDDEAEPAVDANLGESRFDVAAARLVLAT
jgi:hypothetical protein